MMDHLAAAFRLRIRGLNEELFEVETFRAREALSDLYRVDMTLIAHSEIDLQALALQQPATFRIELGERARTFHGLLQSVTFRGVRGVGGNRRHQFDVALVPRAWQLTQRRNSRIFQRLRLDQIVERVLAPYFIPARWVLERAYPVRDYCTQYEESDWDLVTRLCAEAGIFFYFEQPADDPFAEMLPPGLSELLGGAATSAGSALAGSAMAGSAMAGSAMGNAPDLAGDMLRKLPGLAAGAGEVLVFGDSPRAYPAMCMGDAPEWSILAEQVAQSAGASGMQAARQALGAAGEAGLDLAADALGGLVGGASPSLRYRGDSGALERPDERSVLSFFSRSEVKPRAFAYREFDPRRPNAVLRAEHRVDDALHGGIERGREALNQLLGGAIPAAPTLPTMPTSAAGLPEFAGDLAGGAMGSALGALTDQEHLFELYDHHSPFLYPEWDYEHNEPKRMATSARRDAERSGGDSDCPWLEPGRRFSLEGHELDRYNRDYVAIAITHEGRAAGQAEANSYRNQFHCVPAGVAYPPDKPVRRSVQTCLTATVMAADDTRIHTDHAAHIKVRFHWDRGQPGHDFNSCWLRVMQPWAGAGWGALFIPREGCEVVVAFEGGDPDRPLVLGGLYNGVNPPPVALPHHKTRSGFRTASTPGVEGANELWFEDAAGREQIYMHAQHDFDIEVQHDRSLRVQRDDRVSVHRNQELRVEGDVAQHIRGSREVVIGTDDRLRVEGNRHVSSQGDEQRVVEGDLRLRIDGGEQREVHGSRSLVAHGDTVARHGGNVTTVIGSSERRRAWSTHVEGLIRHSSSGTVEISAGEALVLRVGETSVRITANNVELLAKAIALQGAGARLRLESDRAMLQADSAVQAVANNVLLKSSGAGIALGSEARVDGSKVLLNSPNSASDEVQSEPTEPTIIELVDDDGQPLAGHPYRIVLANGVERSGVLDDNGRAEVELDEDGDIYFPGIIDLQPE